jgi:hypothetical protein
MSMVTAIMGTMGIVIIVTTTATEIEVTEIITATMATATMATGTTNAGKALPSHAEAANAVDLVIFDMRTAAEELGHLPIKQWAKQLNVGDPNGLKQYFKFLAIKHPKSYAVILARIMPLHVTTPGNKLPKYITEEQMRAELRKHGLPEDIIKFMHPIDVMSVDPDEVGDADDIYPDPELDDDMLDVPPKETEQ